MAKHQKAYTEEFKREAVRLMTSSGKAITEVTRDMGVNDSVLYRGLGPSQFHIWGDEFVIRRIQYFR